MRGFGLGDFVCVLVRLKQSYFDHALAQESLLSVAWRCEKKEGGGRLANIVSSYNWIGTYIGLCSDVVDTLWELTVLVI